MAKYHVTIKEVHHSYRYAEADSPEEAIEVAMGESEYDCQYVSTCEEGHEAEIVPENST